MSDEDENSKHKTIPIDKFISHDFTRASIKKKASKTTSFHSRPCKEGDFMLIISYCIAGGPILVSWKN